MKYGRGLAQASTTLLLVFPPYILAMHTTFKNKIHADACICFVELPWTFCWYFLKPCFEDICCEWFDVVWYPELVPSRLDFEQIHRHTHKAVSCECFALGTLFREVCWMDHSWSASSACLGKMNDPPRTRTWNLRLRRPTPYPLGQRASWCIQKARLVIANGIPWGSSCNILQHTARTRVKGVVPEKNWDDAC